MKLDGIVSLDKLEAEIKAGYINRRFHPEFPTLATVGYSDKCQFDNRWNETTMACRGIIYDTETLEVIARPFHKFFNHGQGDAQYDLDAPIMGAFNKFDGSLGIRYTRPDGRTAIATRGSFDSEQARHATALVWEWGWQAQVMTDHTFLYEIIYPGNRIVLDYGDSDMLAPLGAVSIETGAFEPSDHPSHGGTLREVLAIPPRKNAEGFVVWIDDQTAVKIKQADYIALHRIISSLSMKEVWRQLRAGTFAEFAAALPDEFHDWAKATAAALRERFNALSDNAWVTHVAVLNEAGAERKAQALWLKANADRNVIGYVFTMLDGREITDSVWRAVEPSGVTEVPTSELIGSAA